MATYVRVCDVARTLGLSKPTVRSLVKRGDIAPALQMGGLVLK
jgi:excisionase family DNA binding protein